MDEHLRSLAARYPTVKFLRGEASLCVPNFPDSNLPTIIVYCDGDVKAQYVGSKALGGHPCDINGSFFRLVCLILFVTWAPYNSFYGFIDLERRLAKSGAINFAETDEADDNYLVERSSGVTRIRTGGRGHCRKASDSDSD